MANTLVVNTLANLGAIIINIYLLFKVSDGFVGQGTFKAKQIAALGRDPGNDFCTLPSDSCLFTSHRYQRDPFQSDQ